jgi:hypothetical protein
MTVITQRPIIGQGVPANLATSTAFGPIPTADRRLSITAVWTGTPSGTFSLEQSTDGGTTWQVVPGAAAEFTANGNLQPGGAAGSAVWNWSNVPGSMVRIKWTASGGTGQLNARASWGP